MPDEPAEVVALGTSFSVVSISAASGVVVGLGYALPNWPVWLIAAFAFTIIYSLGVGVELGLAARVHPEGAKGD